MQEKLTATQLFARHRGVHISTGNHRCFYCLGTCDDTFLSSEFVKTSFSSRDTVGGGEYVCGGCIEAMQEKTSITLIDGTKREGQRVRCYSWIIAQGAAMAATKAHRAVILEHCLTPPAPPFIICLSDSGQRHLLYRSVVCHSRSPVAVSLEGEVIRYAPQDLLTRLALCKKLCAIIGKTALGTALALSQKMMLHDAGISLETLNYWQSNYATGLTRLGVWLTPGKKECADGVIPSALDGRTQSDTVQTAFSWTY